MNLSGLPKLAADALELSLLAASSSTFIEMDNSSSSIVVGESLVGVGVPLDVLGDLTSDLTRPINGSDKRVIFVMKLPKLLLTLVTVDRLFHTKKKNTQKIQQIISP
jgi:hypothetical protein